MTAKSYKKAVKNADTLSGGKEIVLAIIKQSVIGFILNNFFTIGAFIFGGLLIFSFFEWISIENRTFEVDFIIGVIAILYIILVILLFWFIYNQNYLLITTQKILKVTNNIISSSSQTLVLSDISSTTSAYPNMFCKIFNYGNLQITIVENSKNIEISTISNPHIVENLVDYTLENAIKKFQ